MFAVTLWTAGLLWLGAVLGAVLGAALTRALGIPAPLAVALPIVALALVLALWSRRSPAAPSAGELR